MTALADRNDPVHASEHMRNRNFLTFILAPEEILLAAAGVAQPGSANKASNDDQVIDLWLYGRAAKTQRAYWSATGGNRSGLSVIIPV
jgi:hypothetical protein